ncbi:MAG: TonB family protein [Steroidobacteraceae bacterium]
MNAPAESLVPPARPARRRADDQRGRLTRDRLTAMLVLAALLHGLILLGVSFTAPRGSGDDVDRGLEVLLVSDELPAARRNDSATYLAQRSQAGSGNTEEQSAARLPSEARPPPQPEAAQWQAETQGDQVVFTTRQGRTQIHMLPLPQMMAEPAQPVPEQAAEAPQRAGDNELRLRGARRDEYYLSPDTRESPFAFYMYGWKGRVERIGTVNYPSEARRQGLSGNPVIEVEILRDGRLQTARIQRSSGHAEIDAAALAILRLASPFDPFPPDLAASYRSLRFAYEWQFEGGAPKQSTISVP